MNKRLICCQLHTLISIGWQQLLPFFLCHTGSGLFSWILVFILWFSFINCLFPSLKGDTKGELEQHWVELQPTAVASSCKSFFMLLGVWNRFDHLRWQLHTYIWTVNQQSSDTAKLKHIPSCCQKALLFCSYIFWSPLFGFCIYVLN